MAQKTYTADNLMARLRRRYADTNRYVVCAEVANATGFGTNSWVDAVVLCLWPSDGRRRMAFEIKVSRSDFLREVENLKKNEWARQYHHAFWFVAPQGVIKDASEVPEGDGWLAPHGEKLKVMRQPTRKKTAELDEVMMASYMRSVINESERRVRAAVGDAKNNDPDIARGQSALKAVQTHVEKTGITSHYKCKTVEDFEALLAHATMDAEVAKDAHEFQKFIDRFRSQMRSSLEIFAVAANYGVEICDDADGKTKKLTGHWNEKKLEHLYGARRSNENKKELQKLRRALRAVLADINAPPE